MIRLIAACLIQAILLAGEAGPPAAPIPPPPGAEAASAPPVSPGATKGKPVAKPQVHPDEIIFPEDAWAVDVQKKYGAKGDGVTDDTAALRKAMSENFDYHCPWIYLPAGTYLVSDTLLAIKPDGQPFFGTKLQGQNRDKVVIRLKDRSPGFGDPAKPKPVVKLCSRNQLDGGNMGHWNSIFNLTIDTGVGNPGAVGVEYIASNEGAMRTVLIRSGDGSGAMGVDMTKPWPGPCMLVDMDIQGFDYGIRIAHSLYSVTFKDIRFSGQRVMAMSNDGNILCMRGITSANTVPFLKSKGMLVLLEGDLGGGGSSKPAIEHEGTAYLRNVKAAASGGVIRGQGPAIPGEWISDKPQSLFPSPPTSLNLPIEETPTVPWDPPSQWARGARSADGIQAAIDSGKTTVYIPYSQVMVDKPIIIRKNVRRIIGMGSNIFPAKELGDRPVWIYEGTSSPNVVIERMDSGVILHTAKGGLVIRHANMIPANAPGCGPLWMEDVCDGPFTFEHPQKIWAYQLNPECDDFDIRNQAATLFILGFKTERIGVQIETGKNAWTEVLGGLIYPCHLVPADRPMFINEGSMALLLRWRSYVDGYVHRIKVKETRDGVTQTTEKLEERLYTGFKAPYSEPRKAKPAASRPAPEAGRAPAAAPAPVARKADAEAERRFDQRLIERVVQRVKDRRWPSFELDAMRTRVTVYGASALGDLTMAVVGSELTWEWKRLTGGDRLRLALDVAADTPEDHCMAAFYLLQHGDDLPAASGHLAQGGAGAADVLKLFAAPAPATPPAAAPPQAK